MYTTISNCRVCGNPELTPVVDLGMQVLTGVFPRDPAQRVGSGPLELVRCTGNSDACGLIQLKHSYAANEMYGENYGYRSGLNPSMVRHLRDKVAGITHLVRLGEDSLILDIGSNDGTTLYAYPRGSGTLVGIDPIGEKFREYYPPHIRLIPEFFSAATVRKHFADRKATVVTSFSMFYDLESPSDFMRDVASVLAEDGIWVFEQSYLPAMLAKTAYDTICHEHLEYYALEQIEWMASRSGLKILDVEFNDVNGGSFSVTAAKAGSARQQSPRVSTARQSEASVRLRTPAPYERFVERVARSRAALVDFIAETRRDGRTVAGLGASTKGNVLLQYCGLTADDLVCIGEVNPDKFGCFTPGSQIPIRPEDEVLASNTDYLLVLPWHFRNFFLNNPRFTGRRLVFPLPELEVV